MGFCTKCGGKVEGKEAFCTGCGNQVGGEAPAKAESVAAPPPVVAPTYQPTVEIDKRREVLGTWAYIGASILFAIPLIGLIFSIVWAASGSVNLNLRNYSRAYLIMLLIGIVIGVVFISIFAAMAFSFLGSGAWQEILNNANFDY